MRTFHLQRLEDATGVSGVGEVAEGAVFSDGHVALRWVVGPHRSTVAYDNIGDVEAIHGHGGRTRVVFHDQPGPPPRAHDYVPPGGRT
jgi:hypothetical protein